MYASAGYATDVQFTDGRTPYGSRAMGQHNMPQDYATVALPINQRSTLEARSPYMGKKKTGFLPFEDVLQLMIKEYDPVFVPRSLDADDRNPFASFNGLEEETGASVQDKILQYHRKYKMAGVAKHAYQFGADGQGSGITISSKGVTSYTNRCGRRVQVGEPMTWRPDLAELIDTEDTTEVNTYKSKRSRLGTPVAIKGIVVPFLSVGIPQISALAKAKIDAAFTKQDKGEFDAALQELHKADIASVVASFESVIGWSGKTVEDGAIGDLVLY